ncbi:Replication factor C subunit 1 [Anas platyrhynchos]|uniref:Replication factor C subunit 1 n=1 Tax=Anas platyrhynchos TaxID=8839 RepID=R0KWA0_ANAPL|nr:Replication factor C subunit 1 [Anas platyrhynchos]
MAHSTFSHDGQDHISLPALRVLKPTSGGILVISHKPPKFCGRDIRKFFGVVPPGKRQECENVKKSDKIKNGEGDSSGKKRGKETKVKNSPSEDVPKQKQTNKKKRIIYDSDSEEEVQSVKKSKKPSEKKAATSKLGKVLKQHPVVYVSETVLNIPVTQLLWTMKQKRKFCCVVETCICFWGIKLLVC